MTLSTARRDETLMRVFSSATSGASSGFMKELSRSTHPQAIARVEARNQIGPEHLRRRFDHRDGVHMLAATGALYTAIAVALCSMAIGFTVRSRHCTITTIALPAGAALGRQEPVALGSWTRIARLLLAPQRARLVLAWWLTLLATALALVAPWPVKIVIDNAIGRQPLTGIVEPLRGLSPTILALVVGAAGVLLVAAAAVLGYLVTYLMGAVAEQACGALRTRVLDHLLHLPAQSTAGYPLGELTTRASADVARVSDTVTSLAEVLLPELMLLAGMTALTASLDWRLTVVAAAVLPLFVLTARRRNTRVRAAQSRARLQTGLLNACSVDVLGRLPAVQVFGAADDEARRLAALCTASGQANLRALDASARFAPLAEILPGISLAAALVTGTIEITAGRLTIGGLLVFLAYLASLQAPIRVLARLSTTLSRGHAARERLSELLALPGWSGPTAGQGAHPVPARPRVDPSQPRSTAGRASTRGCAVELNGVGFRHRPGHLLLENLDLVIQADETVCLTGPSGSGKTTLLTLLTRLREPDTGTIRLDGRDLRTITGEDLRRSVTLVPQHPWLHTGSIADNIAYGQPRTRLADIVSAARRAGIGEFVSDLPHGYDTEIGEHGQLLSGGQQRRIALARALVRRPALLLLDEPTNGLDAATEIAIMDDLLSGDHPTIILVTHQRHLMPLADHHVTLPGPGRSAEPPQPPDLVRASAAPDRVSHQPAGRR